MRVTLIAFLIVFILFTVIQVMLDKKSSEALGNSVFLTGREIKTSELVLYFFRFVIAVFIGVYFIVRDGSAFQWNLFIFAILMGALTSKAFFPLVPLVFSRKSCGIYENGVITLRGAKLFHEIKYCSYGERKGECMFAFVPSNFYLSRAGYFYAKQKDVAKIKKILSSKCVLQ